MRIHKRKNFVWGSFLLVFNMVVCCCNSYCQTISYEEVKVGETMPDLPLGIVLKNHTGKNNFSALKGKLVILDFWNTRCPDCIAAFPKMEQLQKQFAEKIQIILVNTIESGKEIQARFKETPALRKIQMPDLPSIVDAKSLHALFPHKSEPYHVWIDTFGVVRFKGSSLNTHENKIRNFLGGRVVGFMQGTVKYAGNEPLRTVLQNELAGLRYGTLITAFAEDVADFWGRQAYVNKIDPGSGAIRNTYINRDLAQLYVDAVENEMSATWKENLNIKGGSYLGKFDLQVKDTLRYTWQFLPSEKWTDEMIRGSKFCYEQIMASGVPDSTRKKYMLEDLNRYFGSLYGVTGVIKTGKRSCYVLVRTSAVDKLKASMQTIPSYSVVNGKKIKTYRNTLKGIIREIIYESSKGVNNKDLFNPGDMLFDETGYTDSIEMSLPYVFEGGIRELDELRKALQAYGLDIVIREREVKTLLLKEQ